MGRARTRTVVVGGFMLRVGAQYVYWDSFAAAWRLGPRRLSEVFAWMPFGDSARTHRAFDLFPSATVVWERDRRSN